MTDLSKAGSPNGFAGLKTIVVAPNTGARAAGFKNELRVGWKHNFNNVVWWWGSCANRAAFRKLLDDATKKYGKLTVEERDTDQ